MDDTATAASGPRAGDVDGEGEGGRETVHHTVTACVRCRQRKVGSISRSVFVLETFADRSVMSDEDPMRSRTATVFPMTYITSLQENVRRLHAELATFEQPEEEVVDSQSMARGAGLIKFSENDESRFLGPSSGIAVTRFVMELAKKYTANKSIKDVVPARTAQEIKEKFSVESAKPTSKVYPLISSVAAPSLPSHDLMERLVDLYMAKAQYMLPLLHETSFREEVRAVYGGSTDPTLNFQLRLVIAISMQKLDRQYAGLADSYYLAALPFLDQAVRKMDLSTLQCFALIGQYSLLTPTRTASYWVVGLAAKLCQELGICEESTISRSPSGVRFNTLEVDMRRRLFWIITSMEYGLAHSLGRPSTFGVTVDNINVKFFELCDDRFITPTGLLPGHHAIMKKCIAIHFLKMRLLQAEIRRTLYLKKRDTPTTDEDPWFERMLNKIDVWVANSPKNDEGSGLSPAWFLGRRNTMIVFMYRPSPQIPEPSLDAAIRGYEASVYNIALQKHQAENSIVDVTWIFTQSIFMCLNTVLWSLSYPGIRDRHPREEVMGHVNDALAALDLTADRWPGVQSARQLYERLIDGCMKAYDYESPLPDTLSPASTQDAASSPSQVFSYSPASSAHTSLAGPQSPQSITSSYTAFPAQGPSPQVPGLNQYGYATGELQTTGVQHASGVDNDQITAFANQNDDIPHSQSSNITGIPSTSFSTAYDEATVNNLFSNSFGQVSNQELPAWNMDTTSAAFGNTFPAYAPVDIDQRPWLGSFGDAYSRYMQQTFFPTATEEWTLSEQQQTELMDTLEKSELPDVSNFTSDATTFYTANFP